MPGTSESYGFNRLIYGADTHFGLPVLPIFILDFKRDRRTECQSVAHARAENNPVLLDFHPSATAISSLPALQMDVNILSRKLQTSGNAFENCRQSRSMRFARGEKSKHNAFPF